MQFSTNSLTYQLDKKGYKKYLLSPKADSFSPTSSAFIIDDRNRKICAFDPTTQSWSFCETRPSAQEVNSSLFPSGVTAQGDIDLLCLTHGFGVADWPKRQMENK